MEELRGLKLFFMKILGWNVRGLGLREKRGAIRRLIRKNMIDVLFIQESKREELSASFIREIWGPSDLDFFSKPAGGSSGGLIMLWTLTLSSVCKKVKSQVNIS